MTDTLPVLYCANHPQTPTRLRCNRCEKPICVKCAISTPTGYRCKECVRGQQKTFETALWYDYVTSVAIGSVLSFIGSRLIPVLGFFTIFLAPVAGVIIAEAIRLVVQRRRSKRLYQLSALATVIGSLPVLLFDGFFFIMALSQGSLGPLIGLVWQAAYTFMVTTSMYYRLAGINLRN